jgi:hypothetical protein
MMGPFFLIRHSFDLLIPVEAFHLLYGVLRGVRDNIKPWSREHVEIAPCRPGCDLLYPVYGSWLVWIVPARF